MLIESRGIDLSFFTADEGDNLAQKNRQANPFDEGISGFNQTYLELCEKVIDEESAITLRGAITTQNRAALATLSEELPRRFLPSVWRRSRRKAGPNPIIPLTVLFSWSLPAVQDRGLLCFKPKA